MDFYCDRVGGGLGSLAAFGVAKFRAKSERENWPEEDQRRKEKRERRERIKGKIVRELFLWKKREGTEDKSVKMQPDLFLQKARLKPLLFMAYEQ